MKVRPLLSKINVKTFIDDLLTAYGVEDVETYLSPTADLFESPWDYPNMDKAVDLMNTAIKNNWKIGVLVDEDCDGLMSAGIMVHFLNSIGTSSIPIFHTDKAHGLSNDIFPYIKSLDLNLLIMPDSGSNDAKKCKILNDLGTRTLVLDHHQITRSNPYAIVINHHLNPNLNQFLSGTGVTYKFVQALCEKSNIDFPNYMDMVAVSLVSDICDLSTIENRTYLEHGLNMDNIDGDKIIINPLLKLMFDELAKGGTSPKDIGWSVAPKINAIFRVGKQESKETFFNALIGNGDIEEALAVAKSAHNLQSRTTKKIADELEETLDLSHNVIITYIDNEYKNYSGLIANKLSGKYHKTTIVLRERDDEVYSGSLRSPFKVASLIVESDLANCQGHEEASGILVYKDYVDDLIEWFDEQEFDDSKPVTACIIPKLANVKLAKQCASFSHLWGHGVPAPTFYITGDINGANVTIYEKKTNTIKFSIGGMDFLKFKATDEEVKLFTRRKQMSIEMVVTLEVNEWRGKVTVQGMITDYELHDCKKLADEDWENNF